MASTKLKMNCHLYHGIIGQHAFDTGKEPKPLNLERVKQIQQCIMIMGARKKIQDPKEAGEFMLHRWEK